MKGLLISYVTEASSVGDVMIDTDGVVKVYYTDGTRNASWDRICSNYGSPSAIGRVICRQLGYQAVLTTSIINIR